MLAILPLIPLVVWGAAALGGVSGAGLWLWSEKERKPPYKDAENAYEHFVKAVEKDDYEMYQWCVTTPMSRERFEGEFAKRSQKELSGITEGVGRQYFDNGDTKRWFEALCPWSRKPKKFVFIKVGDSWKLDGDGAE